MKISIGFIGEWIVTMTCEDGGTILTTDISNSRSMVDEGFIESLEDIVYLLKRHNYERKRRSNK